MRIRSSSLEAVVAALEPGMTVFVPGMSGESRAFFDALAAAPDKAEDVRFLGVHFPGINKNDYAGLHPRARLRGYFTQPHLRAPIRDGRVEIIPTDYAGALKDLARQRIDLAIAQVSPPDHNGMMSLGISHDFLPAIWQRAKRRIAHINPAMPTTKGSSPIHSDDCDLLCEETSPLIEFDGGRPSADLLRLGHHVAELVRDGDTLQFGIGKIQSAILRALSGHRHLRVWSGMVCADVLDLLDSGVIAGDAKIEAGVALGDALFYERLGHDHSFFFRPVSETHDVRRIAAIPNFVALNAALEVDLFGQVNSEAVDGCLVAGVGGMPAFTQGAELSPGGRSVICLTATAAKGRISRIVPQLGPGSLVALPRHAADTVVTEYGIARLEGLGADARAERLMEIAAPEFVAELAARWRDIRERL